MTDATRSRTSSSPTSATATARTGARNWEDAFRIGRYFLPRPSAQQPHLAVFITDGDPNEIVREDRVTYDPGNPYVSANEYELKVPLSKDSEVTSADTTNRRRTAPSRTPTRVKAQGSHILTVAVGAGLSSQSSLDRIIDVSGADVFTGSGTFDISTDDVYRVADFSDLEDAMREAAFQLCAPSVTVRKLVDLTPDPGTDDAIPGAGLGHDHDGRSGRRPSGCCRRRARARPRR